MPTPGMFPDPDQLAELEQYLATKKIMQSPMYSDVKESPAASMPGPSSGIASLLGGPTGQQRLGERDLSPGPWDPNEPTNQTYGYSNPNTANELRAFTKAKYGGEGRFGGAAGYINPLEQASEARERTVPLRIKQLQQMSNLGAVVPPEVVDALYGQLVEQPQADVNAQIAGPLKELGAITEQERVQRQGESLGKIVGKMLGLDVSGINPEHTKILAQILGEKRAQRIEEGRGREEDRRERALTLRETKPPVEASVNGLAQQLLNGQGLVARQTQRGWDVFAGPNESTPLKDSPKRWAAARQAATEILMKQRQ